MTFLRHISLPASLCVFAAVLALPAYAVEDAVLIGPDLKRQSIRFVAIGANRMSYFDSDRQLRAAPLEDLVRLELVRQAVTAAAPAVRAVAGSVVLAAEPEDEADRPDRRALHLADGQMLRGRFVGVNADGHVLWQTTELGEVAVSLDRIVRFDGPASGKAGHPALVSLPDKDLLLLANGDRMVGLLESITPAGAKLLVGDNAIDLTWKAVSAVSVANPIVEARGVWLDLLDGSRIHVQKLRVESGRAKGETLGGRSLDLPFESVAAMAFTHKHRLLPLSQLEHEITQGGEAFGVKYKPRFEGGDAHLHAPLTLRFDLPLGAVRFACDSATLDPSALDWADLVLSVKDAAGRSLWSNRLHAKHPADAVNVPLTGRELILELDAGVNGPVRDRLRLVQPAVLVTHEAD